MRHRKTQSPEASSPPGEGSASGSADPEYIFVHGLSGWGSYDKAYRRVPYWGMFGGDLIRYLRRKGFSCFAASVSPEGSAWDRACELYAQLTGTRTDYGAAHSRRCSHSRFGRDFTGCPLIPDWDSGRPLVLLGHSFGGVTVRLFAEMMANGSPEERAAAAPEELSGLFRGGQAGRVRALVTLAAPTNGTTAYDMYQDPDFDARSVAVSRGDDFWGEAFSRRRTAVSDGRSREDRAAFDMHIDNALALNRRIATLPGTYYFAVPCSATEAEKDGTHRPLKAMTEPLFRRSSARMGAYAGTTAGGFPVGADWRENDGLVNTVSAMAPLGEPTEAYEPGRARPGVWQILPVRRGDHMSLQGGMLKRVNIRPFYLELLSMLDSLPAAQ